MEKNSVNGTRRFVDLKQSIVLFTSKFEYDSIYLHVVQDWHWTKTFPSWNAEVRDFKQSCVLFTITFAYDCMHLGQENCAWKVPPWINPLNVFCWDIQAWGWKKCPGSEYCPRQSWGQMWNLEDTFSDCFFKLLRLKRVDLFSGDRVCTRDVGLDPLYRPVWTQVFSAQQVFRQGKSRTSSSLLHPLLVHSHFASISHCVFLSLSKRASPDFTHAKEIQPANQRPGKPLHSASSCA